MGCRDEPDGPGCIERSGVWIFRPAAWMRKHFHLELNNENEHMYHLADQTFVALEKKRHSISFSKTT